MRTRTVQADGWTLTIRGRTRRTTALESEYMVSIRQHHPESRDVPQDSTDREALINRNPRAWSLLGVASTFRYLVARCSEAIDPAGDVHAEPFKPDVLIRLFEHYLDCEQLPDKSDLWSQAETAIDGMDKPEVPKDPLAASDS